MANPTTNLSVTLPTVGGDADQWGTILNDAFQALDDIFVDGGTGVSVNIDGGSIDGAVIGGSTAAAGSFTTVDASSDLTVGADAAVTGEIRLENDATVEFRNGANTADLEALSVSASDKLEIGLDASMDSIQLGTSGVNTTVAGALAVDGASTFTGAVEIDNTLNHDGSSVGFYGATPVAQASAITAVTITPVSGTGDDLTVNAGLDDLAAAVNAIRAALANIGITA